MAVTEVITEQYAIYNTDCVEFLQKAPDNCFDMVVYSPPFRGLYNYSSDPRDMSNSRNSDEFYKHYDYLVKQLARTTKAGRIHAVHAAEIPDSNVGVDNLHDLPGGIVKLYQDNGFRYIGRHTIWKEPLGVRMRTMQKSLQHQTIVEDGTRAGIAGNDYLLIFAALGENKVPVVKETGFTYYAGESEVPPELNKYKGWTGKQTENRYSQWVWRQYASGVWDDIRLGNVLPYKPAKEEEDEKHVHPLQLDVIERAVLLYSNPGEVVFTPFLGVGSEAYGAVSLGRKAVGTELKASYFSQAAKNLEHCEPLEESMPEQLTLV